MRRLFRAVVSCGAYACIFALGSASPVGVRQLAAQTLRGTVTLADRATPVAGAIAAHTTLPVIGVPLASANAIGGGLDALLSTVQMPRGVPVATVAVGEAGAANAAILAAQILATADPAIGARIKTMRETMALKVLGG